MAKDALGNDIVVGNKYGYASSVNGIPTVVVGVASLCKSELKVTLRQVQRRSGLYGKIEDKFEAQEKSVSPYACTVFPVN